MADGWRVSTQRQTTALMPGGNFEQVVEVTFTTDSGVTGHVDVPLRLYSADHVHEQIADYVARIEAVNKL